MSTDWFSLAAEGQSTLEAAGFSADEARRDAVLLARSVLGWDAADWLTRSRERAEAEAASRLRALIDRRRRHEPIAYLTGTREFYGREFSVTSDVLIPRPETELIVEEALQALQILRLGPWALGPGPAIADVGTGSGCLAITLALEVPSARVIAIDLSEAALAVAAGNAARLGAPDRVSFVRASLLAKTPGPFDLIVANLPYVAERDRATLPLEVAFEPATALFGGPDGLDVFRALVPQAAGALAPGGWLVMELGQGQINNVEDLIAGMHGLAFHHVRADLQGILRVVVARTPGEA